jgi:hypothetical protein
VDSTGDCARRVNGMPELEDDLHATAESIAADAKRLSAIEEKKAVLEADDPRMIELSAEGERLARGLVPKTSAETQLAKESKAI